MITCMHARINTYTTLTACQRAHAYMQHNIEFYFIRCLDQPTSCLRITFKCLRLLIECRSSSEAVRLLRSDLEIRSLVELATAYGMPLWKQNASLTSMLRPGFGALHRYGMAWVLLGP